MFYSFSPNVVSDFQGANFRQQGALLEEYSRGPPAMGQSAAGEKRQYLIILEEPMCLMTIRPKTGLESPIYNLFVIQFFKILSHFNSS